MGYKSNPNLHTVCTVYLIEDGELRISWIIITYRANSEISNFIISNFLQFVPQGEY